MLHFLPPFRVASCIVACSRRVPFKNDRIWPTKTGGILIQVHKNVQSRLIYLRLYNRIEKKLHCLVFYVAIPVVNQEAWRKQFSFTIQNDLFVSNNCENFFQHTESDSRDMEEEKKCSFPGNNSSSTDLRDNDSRWQGVPEIVFLL